MRPLDTLSAWRLDHAWMHDEQTRPIADAIAIIDAQDDPEPPSPSDEEA